MGSTVRQSAWNFGLLGPLSLAKRTWRAFNDNQLHARCAQFAFYSMLALVPLLIVIINGIAMLPLEGVLDAFMEVIQRSLPIEAYKIIQAQILGVHQASSTSLLVINLVIFGFAGARLFITISEGLNVAFGLAPRHRRIRAFGLSWVMPMLYALLLLVALILLVIAPLVTRWTFQLLELPRLESFLLNAVRWIVVVGFLLVLTSTMYCLIPAKRIPWRWFTPGNVFAVVGWLIASHGFRIYVDNFAHYNETYGALGGVIVLLLWLYLTGAILLVGGQINGVIFGEADLADAQN